MSQKLGKMTRIDPREVWPNEEKDFNPWLADEGIRSLGDSVGLYLDFANKEVSAGQFRADVICHDQSDGDHPQIVVIENQLGPSDHDHLGKLITYGAVLNADVCIWVATGFKDEHLEAVRRLNYPDDRLVDYYCVRLSVCRVDDSLPVPVFDTIVGPEGWRPLEIATVATDYDDQTRSSFWDLLDEGLVNRGMSKTIPGKNPDYRRFDIEVPGVSIYLDRDADRIRVGLRIYRTHRGLHTGWDFYRRLQTEQSAIGREIGEPLTWRGPSNRLNAVEVSTESHLHDESKWKAEVDWMIDRTKTLSEVLRPRLGEPLSR